jgi:hypothetical protein
MVLSGPFPHFLTENNSVEETENKKSMVVTFHPFSNSLMEYGCMKSRWKTINSRTHDLNSKKLCIMKHAFLFFLNHTDLTD